MHRVSSLELEILESERDKRIVKQMGREALRSLEIVEDGLGGCAFVSLAGLFGLEQVLFSFEESLRESRTFIAEMGRLAQVNGLHIIEPRTSSEFIYLMKSRGTRGAIIISESDTSGNAHAVAILASYSEGHFGGSYVEVDAMMGARDLSVLTDYGLIEHFVNASSDQYGGFIYVFSSNADDYSY